MIKRISRIWDVIKIQKDVRVSFRIIGMELRKKAEVKRRDDECRRDFLENLMPTLDQMSVSNGSKYYEKQKVKIAIIADQFLFDAFNGAAEFLYITQANYLDCVEQTKFLLVASAWNGLHDEWRAMATEGTETNRILHQTMEAYKKAGKPIVFYNKEDPPGYQHFLSIAKKADVIFTSCEEKVADYKQDCSTDQVYVMEFCINPAFHNPIGMKNPFRTNGVFFAGSWRLKYPERTKPLEIMLDGAIDSGRELVIADRNFSWNDILYFFPRRYYRYLTKEIPHDYLQKVHKLYDWAININTITESRTMFANRVCELQANGCLLLSNPSVGVQEKFPEVVIVHTKEEVKEALNRYSGEELYLHQLAGIRCVMTKETCYDRMAQLLEVLGIEAQVPERRVLVVADQITPKLRMEFEEQTYPWKNLVEKNMLTEALYSDADMVARWSKKSSYGKFYLEDMINAFKYTACDYIVKDRRVRDGAYIGNVEHNYVENIADVYATVFWRECIDMREFLSIKSGTGRKNGYSIDCLNYESS